MIRRAIPEDTDRIMDLLYQVHQVHADGRPDLFVPGMTKYTPDEVRELLKDDTKPIYVLLEDGVVAGYVFCVYEITEEGGGRPAMKTLYIDDLCVDEAFRRRGIGKKLYDFTCDVARENGCSHVTLHVWACNPGAEAFYRSLGMETMYYAMETVL